MVMNLKALRAFTLVMELGSLTAAADQLHLSTSAVSRLIAQLEAMNEVVEPRKFLSLAFLSLSVIPNLKVNDWGIMKFDPANGDLGPRVLEDQRVKAPVPR